MKIKLISLIVESVVWAAAVLGGMALVGAFVSNIGLAFVIGVSISLVAEILVVGIRAGFKAVEESQR